MDTRLLKTFLMVAQLQNITQAAEKLNFSQPTITAQIQHLEEILGVLLFERQGKRLIITDAGKELYLYAEKTLALLNEIQMTMEPYRKEHATLTVGVSAHFINQLLPPILGDYQKYVPEGSIKLRYFSNTKETLSNLLDNQFYIGLIHERIEHAQFEIFKIFTDEVLWLGHRSLLEKYNFSHNISDYPFISYTKDTVFGSHFGKIFEEMHCVSKIEHNDSLAVKQAVLNRLGISVLPYCLVKDEIEDGTLIQIENTPALFMNVYVIFKRSMIFSPSVYKFLKILSELPQADEHLKVFIKSRKNK